MEENIIKHAKKDIHEALYKIISFDIEKKGASPDGIKRYYKKHKNVPELLSRIRHKRSNIFKNDQEYAETVLDILFDILDDRISHNKDKKDKAKYIKEWTEFNEGYAWETPRYSKEQLDDLKKKLKQALEFATNSFGRPIDSNAYNKAKIRSKFGL